MHQMNVYVNLLTCTFTFFAPFIDLIARRETKQHKETRCKECSNTDKKNVCVCIITVLFFMIDQWLTCNLSPRIWLDVHKMWWRWHCQGTGWGVSRKTTRQLLVRITWQNLTKVKVIKNSQHNKYHQVKQKINDCLHQKFHYM